jgi:hypothetical protein
MFMRYFGGGIGHMTEGHGYANNAGNPVDEAADAGQSQHDVAFGSYDESTGSRSGGEHIGDESSDSDEWPDGDSDSSSSDESSDADERDSDKEVDTFDKHYDSL